MAGKGRCVQELTRQGEQEGCNLVVERRNVIWCMVAAASCCPGGAEGRDVNLEYFYSSELHKSHSV